MPLNLGFHRLPTQIPTTSLFIFLLFFVAMPAAVWAAPCTPTGPSPSVTICSPANGATVASPVEISAAATSSPAATLIQIYLDGVKSFETHASSLDHYLEGFGVFGAISSVGIDNGTFGCAGDEDWLDLADAALLAQESLNTAGVEVEIPIADADDTGMSNG